MSKNIMNYSVICKTDDGKLLIEVSNVSYVDAHRYVCNSLNKLRISGDILNDVMFINNDYDDESKSIICSHADIILKGHRKWVYYIIAQMGNEKFISNNMV